jgi:hypothetical protein
LSGIAGSANYRFLLDNQLIRSFDKRKTRIERRCRPNEICDRAGKWTQFPGLEFECQLRIPKGRDRGGVLTEIRGLSILGGLWIVITVVISGWDDQITIVDAATLLKGGPFGHAPFGFEIDG